MLSIQYALSTIPLRWMLIYQINFHFKLATLFKNRSIDQKHIGHVEIDSTTSLSAYHLNILNSLTQIPPYVIPDYMKILKLIESKSHKTRL